MDDDLSLVGTSDMQSYPEFVDEHFDDPTRIAMRVQRLRSDGTFRAFSCPSCGYGPMDHAHCDDLTEHHQQSGCNNSCPRCGTFVKDVTHLTPWRG